MTILALAFVLPTAALLAYIGGIILDRREPPPSRQTVGARYVDAPGFPPLPRRHPGDTAPTPAQTADWESDDCLPADGLWCAWWPPGSLGDYPDGLPAQPGRLSHEDSLDVLIAASKLTRAAAEQRKSA
jgi:hypothetical protein